MIKAIKKLHDDNKSIGDCTELIGDCSWLIGDCTELRGDFDDCDISLIERMSGVEINNLVMED